MTQRPRGRTRGYARGVSSPSIFRGTGEDETAGLVHGDDFVGLNNNKGVDAIEVVLGERCDFKRIGRLGPGSKDDKECCFPNRILRYIGTPKEPAMELEADTKHARAIVETARFARCEGEAHSSHQDDGRGGSRTACGTRHVSSRVHEVHISGDACCVHGAGQNRRCRGSQDAEPETAVEAPWTPRAWTAMGVAGVQSSRVAQRIAHRSRLRLRRRFCHTTQHNGCGVHVWQSCHQDAESATLQFMASQQDSEFRACCIIGESVPVSQWQVTVQQHESEVYPRLDTSLLVSYGHRRE